MRTTVNLPPAVHRRAQEIAARYDAPETGAFIREAA